MAPSRIAGGADPYFRPGAMLVEGLLHVANDFRPTLPSPVGGTGQTMDADGVDVLHDAAAKHQLEPIRIEDTQAAEQSPFTPALRPVGGAANHGAECLPVRIKSAIPLGHVIGFV